MNLHHTITMLSLSLLLLDSCKEADELSGDDVPGYSPVLVSASPASTFTRGFVANGMYDNFKVFAAAEKDGARTVAMNGYEVKFMNDDWSYVTDSQPLAYWNPNADSYLFTAGAPIDAVTSINATSMTLRLENNKTGSVMAAEPLKIANSSDDFGKRVKLRFGYVHCRVCVAFIKEDTEDISVTGITLTPLNPIASKASVTYTYDWNEATPKATQQVSTTETSAEAFSFADVTIPANSTKAKTSATLYYCVPDANNEKQWSVSVNCKGEQKSATFENNKTWQSGKNYIYVFSLSEKNPKLVKVIEQELYFDCNDIVSGGEFSDNNMTE